MLVFFSKCPKLDGGDFSRMGDPPPPQVPSLLKTLLFKIRKNWVPPFKGGTYYDPFGRKNPHYPTGEIHTLLLLGF